MGKQYVRDDTQTHEGLHTQTLRSPEKSTQTHEGLHTQTLRSPDKSMQTHDGLHTQTLRSPEKSMQTHEGLHTQTFRSPGKSTHAPRVCSQLHPPLMDMRAGDTCATFKDILIGKRTWSLKLKNKKSFLTRKVSFQRELLILSATYQLCDLGVLGTLAKRLGLGDSVLLVGPPVFQEG